MRKLKRDYLKRNDAVFVDIQTDLNNSFNGKIVSATEEDDFINHYVSHFKEAYSLAKTLKTFNITPSATSQI